MTIDEARDDLARKTRRGIGTATHVALPPVVAAIYAVTCVMLLGETRARDEVTR